MRTGQWVLIGTVCMALAGHSRLIAQATTEVPPVVAGAKPVVTEKIKVHGVALEGNLEGAP